ncbi:MAG: response regulator transcription factor [Planctomycetota bacterium]|nr:response regulator transcription factor [Planctomycetota bacterium]
MQRHIMVVEDEADLADLIALHLKREGYRVSTYGDGNQGLAAIERDVPDLVVLDLMLPGLDGFEICRRIRRDERLAAILILMVTARGEEADVITGLELGADDSMVKPFSPRVLVARVRTLIRRLSNNGSPAELLRVGPVEVDTGRHEVHVDGEEVTLTHTEFLILRYMAAKPGRVRSRGEILEMIGDSHVLERTVDVHVSSLRRKLGEAGERLETVRGVGYRLKD